MTEPDGSLDDTEGTYISAGDAIPHQPPCADQHQAVNQLGGTGRGQGAVNDDQSLLLGFCQVRGNGWAVARCTGDQGVQRGAPGVHRVWDQVDVFYVHGGNPQAAWWVWVGFAFRPRATAAW